MFSSGRFYYPNGRGAKSKNIGAKHFTDGNAITVTVDLDANTISFKKNGTANGTPQGICCGAYFFACQPNGTGGVVTIVQSE